MATADYLRIADLLIVIIIGEGSGPKLFELSYILHDELK